MGEPYDDPGMDGPWIDCWQCGGEGHLEDCFEDTCVCMDPPCNEVVCDVCRGAGGWWAKEYEPADPDGGSRG